MSKQLSTCVFDKSSRVDNAPFIRRGPYPLIEQPRFLAEKGHEVLVVCNLQIVDYEDLAFGAIARALLPVAGAEEFCEMITWYFWVPERFHRAMTKQLLEGTSPRGPQLWSE